MKNGNKYLFLNLTLIWCEFALIFQGIMQANVKLWVYLLNIQILKKHRRKGSLLQQIKRY